jgi:hypothetical protein
MQYVRPNDGTTSEMFLDAQHRCYGSFYVECRCGIQHYAVDSRYRYSWEDDIEVPPETTEGDFRVQHHGDCDSIGYFEFIGQMFVHGCEGCSKYLRRYEDFIWEERDTIRNYLKIRIDQEKQWADQEHIKNILAGIV